MKLQKQHSITKISAKLLIVASLACVLFGNGVHIHSMVDHIFDHGDLHVLIHAHDHSSDTSEEGQHTSDQENDNHQIAKVDLFGVLSQTNLLATYSNLKISFVMVIQDWDIHTGSVIVYELDLPPPDKSSSEFLSSSHSLRAPPLA
ncbi:MAG: hypothetical protein JJ895_02685 [Balneolaceae bacterium]|nr:hypothetical protein [Balneolaceae bacterium]